jgi:HAD superfamily hydrolase (TIGR01509 family)
MERGTKLKLHHIGIEVEDLYAMELFYRQVLGFSRVYRYRSVNTPGLRTCFLERGGLSLELLERPRPAGYLDRRAGAGHLALEVPDVDRECRRLEALGFPGLVLAAPRNTGDGFREAELRDPEGNVIELSARIAEPPSHPVRAVLFDLDGTLIDSEPNYYLADQKLLARFGLDFTEADKRRYIGTGIQEMVRDLKERHGLPGDPAELAAEKNALYLEIAEAGTELFPPMKRFVDHLAAAGIPMAVASGSSPEVIRRLVKQVGLDGCFEHLVSAEEAGRSKPAPDVFLEAARRLGVPPEECLVVEDSAPGVESASRALMRCIAVPFFTDPPLAPAYAMADLLFPSGMASFDPDAAWEWVRRQGAPAPAQA